MTDFKTPISIKNRISCIVQCAKIQAIKPLLIPGGKSQPNPYPILFWAA